MYPEKTDKYLRKFKKQTIKIGSEKVKVWVHNEAEEMYLIYLMNWDGEVALYQFDAKENVFQRFIISDSQEEALNTAEQTFDDLDEKYQAMVHKYNKDNSAKWKVIIALISVIVVLAFVILNLILKILSQKRIVLDVEEKALRATTKKSKYLVEKPGIKTVVPNQKVVKKPKEDVEVKDVVPTGYDDISIDMTDDVIKEYEKSSKPDSVANKEADVKIKSVTPADVKSKKVATTAVKETEEKKEDGEKKE